MKRIIALAITLIMALTLAACGGGGDTPSETPNSQGNTTPTADPPSETPNGGNNSTSQGSNNGSNSPANPSDSAPAGNSQPPTPAEQGERGNTAGNIRKGGYAAAKEDWVYYQVYDVLYKMRTDGTDISVIDPGVKVSGRIDVIGDWIYAWVETYTPVYLNGLYRFRNDSAGLTEIPLTTVEYGWTRLIAIVGDWIYYASSGKDGADTSVYRIRTDGTEDTFLFETKNPAFIDVADDWVYYYDAMAPENYNSLVTLKRARTDGSSPESMTLPNEWRVDRVQIYGEWLYFRDESRFLSKMHLETHERIVVAEKEVNSFIIDGNWVYFDDGSDSCHIYKMRTDGTGLTTVIDEGVVDFNVAGDWIIYNLTGQTYETQAYYRIRTDGTGRELAAEYEEPYYPSPADTADRIDISFGVSNNGIDSWIECMFFVPKGNSATAFQSITIADFSELRILRDGVEVPFEIDRIEDPPTSGDTYTIYFVSHFTEPGTYVAEWTFEGKLFTSFIEAILE